MVDSLGMSSALKEVYKQVTAGYGLAKGIKVEGVEKVAIAGMGGSGIGGEILKSYFHDSKFPVFTTKDYNLPKFLDDKTLLFIVSYSGNTEETLEAYKQAADRNLKTVVLAHGGKLEKEAFGNSPFIKIPETIQPRMSYCYQFFSMLGVLENSGLVGKQKDLVEALEEKMKSMDFEQKAKEISKNIENKIPIIYSSERLKAAAYKWKININENAKTMAFCNVFPEQNHNEINGLINPKAEFVLVFLKDPEDHTMIRKRMEAVKKIASVHGVKSVDVNVTGGNLLEKLITTIYLGDWTSYFLALEYRADPTPVPLIEDFKKMLAD